MDIFRKLMQRLELQVSVLSRKSIVNKLGYLLMALFPASCSAVSPGSQALENFQANFTKEIKRDYGFTVYATGASFPVKINSINMQFCTGYPATIEEGRKLIVPLVHKFIKSMNEDNELLKYLSNVPARLENVDLMLKFEQSVNSPLGPIIVVGSKNAILYTSYNEKAKRLDDLHEETFDEAEKILSNKLESKEGLEKSDFHN